MKPKATLIAVALVALLGAYVWFFERGEPMKEGQLINLDPEDATAIELVKGEETITIERRGDDWFLTAPIVGAADDESVKNIIEDAARFTPKATRAGQDLSDPGYGLVDPVAVARVDFGSKTVEISIGSEPITGEFFAKLAGDDTLYTVASVLKSHIEKAADDLRERDVAKFDMKDIRELTLTRGEESLRLVNEPESATGESEVPPSKWRIVEPVQARADSNVVDTVARTISNLRVEEFVDTEPAGAEDSMDFLEPPLIASVGLQDGKRIVVDFGAEIEKVDAEALVPEADDSPAEEKAPEFQRYVRRQGRDETFLVRAQSFTDVDKMLADLRDKKLMDIVVGDVESFSLERSDGDSFSGQKIDGDWQVTAGGAETIAADAFKTEDILYDLKDLEAASFVDDAMAAEAGLDTPFMTIEIKTKDSDAPVRIVIGSLSGDKYYARVGDDPQVILLDAFKIDGLHDELSDFQKAEDPEPEEPGAIEEPTGLDE